MDTFNLKKLCDVCEKPIPDSFGNLLCMEHYHKQTAEIAKKEKEEAEEKGIDLESTPEVTPKEVTETPDIPEPEFIDPEKVNLRQEYKKTRKDEPIEMGEPASQAPDSSISDPNYRENPQAPDKDQIMANLIQFMRTDILLYHHQKGMYNFIKDYMSQKAQRHAQFSKHIWKPRVVDVGCGSGVGTNILSQEADFVWGIDKNKKSLSFAKQAFTREKNGIYYNAQAQFDLIDVMTTEFEFDKFDMVVAIEVIEHINDWRTFMDKLIINFTKRNKKGEYEDKTHAGKNGDFYNGTEFFISTPNRNSSKISNVRPKNIFHVREWTAQEFKDAMSQYFENVELYTWTGEKVDVDTTHTPIFAKCRKPKS